MPSPQDQPKQRPCPWLLLRLCMAAGQKRVKMCHSLWHKRAPCRQTRPPCRQRGFSAPLLLALPWGHHALLMEKVKDATARQWYMQAAIDNGWSRYLLQDHIQAASHQRAGKAASNFSLRLPATGFGHGAADAERSLPI